MKPELKTVVLGGAEFTIRDLTVQFYEELQAMKLVPLQEQSSNAETLHRVIMDNAMTRRRRSRWKRRRGS